MSNLQNAPAPFSSGSVPCIPGFSSDGVTLHSNFPEKSPPAADKLFVRAFLQQAGDILDIAASGDSALQDMAILIDRQGGMRMLDPSGWSLPALSAEFGAAAVYKVERRGTAVRVEGWDGSQRCLLQRNSQPTTLFHLPGTCVPAQPMMLLPIPLLA